MRWVYRSLDFTLQTVLKLRLKRNIRVCLAASGGGHVRQLLDLSDAWASLDHCFVTEPTALGYSIARDHRTHFVTHVALGQARLGSPFKMALAAVRNFFESAAIIFRERPDVVVSTGAGSVYFSLLWARLLGARIVVIESFARFDHPSAFARIAGPLAHHKVVQSPALSAYWPDAEVFDPLRMVDGPRPDKKPLLFATVGATLPFDRLVESVAALKARGEISESVFVQTGIGGARPAGVDTVETLPFEGMIARLREADIVVCHGGTGSLITALREGCRTIAMPRLFSLGEHYDDHQEEITEAFRARGLIAVAKSEDELSAALKLVRDRTPPMATSDPAELTTYVKKLLAEAASR
ncbi:beta-1,4-glucuronosyltransferase WelK [Phenylobacterium sp.]|uniref:beta-1,4-glucuronosyltransferase WelK n=1 Tax=Phenylobacterium sp. TaxID=1871053 RepID=UPI00374D8DA8